MGPTLLPVSNYSKPNTPRGLTGKSIIYSFLLKRLFLPGHFLPDISGSCPALIWNSNQKEVTSKNTGSCLHFHDDAAPPRGHFYSCLNCCRCNFPFRILRCPAHPTPTSLYLHDGYGRCSEHILQDSSTDLLYNKGNVSPIFCDNLNMGKESEKDWICVYVKLHHFVVQQKLTQNSKSTRLPSNF